MKENDIVTLINLKQEYKNKNLYLNAKIFIMKKNNIMLNLIVFFK